MSEMNQKVREHRGLHILFPWPNYPSEYSFQWTRKAEAFRVAVHLENYFRIIPKIFPPLGLEAFFGHPFTAPVG